MAETPLSVESLTDILFSNLFFERERAGEGERKKSAMKFQMSFFKDTSSRDLAMFVLSIECHQKERKGQKIMSKELYYWHHSFLYGEGVSMEKCNPFRGAVEFQCGYKAGKM